LEAPADGDIVIGVPEPSLSAAQGYAAGSGIPYDQGLIKNKYSGRTFIESTQERRDLAVYLKLSPIRPVVEGKRIVLVDDSIVRDTTSRQLVSMMRAAGAREVHMRIASPKMIAPCFYGVDTSSYEQLIGSTHSVEEIRERIGADSLAFLSNEGLRRALGKGEVCDACFTGRYPTDLCDYAGSVR
ncbi:amidophosphoribosyltransferase, partial [Gleimia europaea]|nr:amidophosphoribosyltransferase [Gleimia europaea]